MIERTYREYRDVLRALASRPRVVLEVGARPDASSLLAAGELADAFRIGVNLSEPGRTSGFTVAGMDARALAFPDESFDLVICASTLEHVPDFWVVCSEMKRVLAPDGILIASVPGYGESALGNRLRQLGFTLGLPDWWKRATATMRVHDAPHDYYRFSEYAFRDVILDGLADIHTWRIMIPPRIYGMGRKPAARAGERAGHAGAS